MDLKQKTWGSKVFGPHFFLMPYESFRATESDVTKHFRKIFKTLSE